MSDGRLPVLLIADDGRLDTDWPFVERALRHHAEGTFEVRYRHVESPNADVDLADVDAVALFGGEPSLDQLESSALRVAGGVTEHSGPINIEWFWEHDVPWIEATAAWAQSVAEVGLGLMISALRRIPYWHHRLASGWSDWSWPFVQYADDDRFVNGTIAGATVGLVGLGQIGGRLASWCHELGAHVVAFDPYVSPERFIQTHAHPVALDELIDAAEILVVAVPPTPSALGIIDARRINRLRRGAIVVSVTRAAALDADALRARVLAGELLWATDVYDIEPLPADDPLRGRDNTVLTPHIAGRTRQANLAVARILCDGFTAVVSGGERPQHVLTPHQVRVRLGAPSRRHLADNPRL